jgi:hypothetical protein
VAGCSWPKSPRHYKAILEWGENDEKLKTNL